MLTATPAAITPTPRIPDDHRYRLHHAVRHGRPLLERSRHWEPSWKPPPEGLPRQANQYGQADGDHASLWTGLDNAEQPDRYLRIRRLGVRVPPSAPPNYQVTGLTPHRRTSARSHLDSFWTCWPHQLGCRAGRRSDPYRRDRGGRTDQGGAYGAAGPASAPGSAVGRPARRPPGHTSQGMQIKAAPPASQRAIRSRVKALRHHPPRPCLSTSCRASTTGQRAGP
jgi:hypothetical protein